MNGGEVDSVRIPSFVGRNCMKLCGSSVTLTLPAGLGPCWTTMTSEYNFSDALAIWKGQYPSGSSCRAAKSWFRYQSLRASKDAGRAGDGTCGQSERERGWTESTCRQD
jgi:hypothetical protein